MELAFGTLFGFGLGLESDNTGSTELAFGTRSILGHVQLCKAKSAVGGRGCVQVHQGKLGRVRNEGKSTTESSRGQGLSCAGRGRVRDACLVSKSRWGGKTQGRVVEGENVVKHKIGEGGNRVTRLATIPFPTTDAPVDVVVYLLEVLDIARQRKIATPRLWTLSWHSHHVGSGRGHLHPYIPCAPTSGHEAISGVRRVSGPLSSSSDATQTVSVTDGDIEADVRLVDRMSHAPLCRCRWQALLIPVEAQIGGSRLNPPITATSASSRDPCASPASSAHTDRHVGLEAPLGGSRPRVRPWQRPQRHRLTMQWLEGLSHAPTYRRRRRAVLIPTATWDWVEAEIGESCLRVCQRRWRAVLLPTATWDWVQRGGPVCDVGAQQCFVVAPNGVVDEIGVSTMSTKTVNLSIFVATGIWWAYRNGNVTWEVLNLTNTNKLYGSG
ncbi:hypothetical protein GGX14DRAFT_403278 [Mycena pura]|uniref:Uncharacterized protein n=1 Tax=Mycena pura TaxID=153505 RepID=A0AAD6Y6J8_9AGAR|nr:hypothetical protein GGX14DRAFT_403278 [Mycena pura]